jgi:uncharacterized protein (DUF1499 family)
MLRRPLTAEPMSRLAAWSARLGWFALAVAVLSVVVVRSGILEIVPALATFAAALAFAALAILLAFAAFVSIWRQGRTGLGRAVLGLLLGLALIAYPAFLGYRAWKLPAIYDITTDTNNPPRFDVLAGSRPPGLNTYRSTFASLQRSAYPNIGPLQYDAPPRIVYDIVLKLIDKRKWRIADARPPAAGRREAVIEAVARSLVMGFPDDVAIRITPLSAGTRVDVRSASRHPWPDLGANASRVQALLDDIDEAVSSAPEPRRPPEPQPKAPPPPKRQPTKR